ncbi:DinB family protein [Bacillus atrophaeus]|uniref:DinB family protein n=1 Tax=Bacillus atrophaeus TaxID=1452 RepID=UPI0022802FE5|nr:DinB family protein [Bacillus atrophaeus]MCY8914417.1 DinB family protein [Bacillus atrophaeus]MCY9114505.1 DinB family protein [Bacillus atrophaeus]MEC0926549.1 DinB family protein [Bacillus atrophaeus]MEC0932611.1 DinB family protein [Bacillus atrophaeus]
MAHLELQLYEYNTWANQQIFNRLKELPKDVYRQKVQSVFPSIAHVLAHVYLSDLGWIEVFSGKSLNQSLMLAEQLKEQTESKEIEEMETMFFELSERYKSLLHQDEHIDKPLVIKNPSGDLKTSVSELVPHVVNHGTYHRGNIAAMLRQIGHASVPTDYGVYLYLITKGE